MQYWIQSPRGTSPKHQNGSSNVVLASLLLKICSRRIGELLRAWHPAVIPRGSQLDHRQPCDRSPGIVPHRGRPASLVPLLQRSFPFPLQPPPCMTMTAAPQRSFVVAVPAATSPSTAVPLTTPVASLALLSPLPQLRRVLFKHQAMRQQEHGRRLPKKLGRQSPLPTKKSQLSKIPFSPPRDQCRNSYKHTYWVSGMRKRQPATTAPGRVSFRLAFRALRRRRRPVMTACGRGPRRGGGGGRGGATAQKQALPPSASPTTTIWRRAPLAPERDKRRDPAARSSPLRTP